MPPDNVLFGPAQHPNPRHSGKVPNTQWKVSYTTGVEVDGLKNNLLGLLAITALGLTVRVGTTSVCSLSPDKIKQQFPKVFQGLGNLGGEYHIPDAEPYALFTARHVPLPLRSKVSEELDWMVKAGVISKVSEPTPWCAGMVVALKKSEAIR